VLRFNGVTFDGAYVSSKRKQLERDEITQYGSFRAHFVVVAESC